MERIIVFEGTRAIGEVRFEWLDPASWSITAVEIDFDHPLDQQLVEEAAFTNSLELLISGGVMVTDISGVYEAWPLLLATLSQRLVAGWTIVEPRNLPKPTELKEVH